MFPDPFHPENECKTHGKMFSLQEIGPQGMHVSHRHIVTDLREWDDYLACPEFESC